MHKNFISDYLSNVCLTCLLIFVLFLPFPELFSQIKIKSEKSEGNVYKLEYFYENQNYQIIKKDQANFLHFGNFLDESDPGGFILPSYNIYISLPPESKPSVRFSVSEQVNIDAFAEQNPEISMTDDNKLQYTESGNYPAFSRKSPFEVRGYIWIGNNYCLHAVIHPFMLNSDSRSVYKITRFSVSLSFPQAIQLDDKSPVANTDAIISNPVGAGSFKANPRLSIIKNDDWIDYNKYYIKLGVARDGIYRLNYDDLVKLGFSPFSVNPKTFKLIQRGKEIPIFVSGENDGLFNNDDFIEFAGQRNMGGDYRKTSQYGKPYNEYLDRYSDTTVYWLTWDGPDGQRVSVFDGNNNLAPSDTLIYYNSLKHIENNYWFDFSMADQVRRESPFWYENKTWHEGNLAVGTRNISFPTPDIYPGKNVYVYAKLQDYASNISKNSHLLAIGLNNQPVQDSGFVDKYQQKVLSGVYNSGSLLQNNNILKIYSYPTNATINTCIVDWYELEYPRYLKMSGDTLAFSFPYLNEAGIHSVKLTGAAANKIIIWKYSDGYRKYNAAADQGIFYFADTVSALSRFIAASDTKILKPVVYYMKKFENLSSSKNTADYLMITHKKFYEKSLEYASFIAEKYGLKTKVIDIDDIYDEFSYGFFNPEYIREFLKTTHTTWSQPYPGYVLLAGAATYDYYHNKTRFMKQSPTYNYVPSFGASVSDNWFVIWDSTGAYIPQMNIGRLPVNTNEELQAYLDKHRNYVSGNYDDWNKRYIFFSGGTGDNQYQLDQLRNVNQYIIDNSIASKPVGGSYKHFYKTISPKTNFGPYTTAEVQKTIEQGAVAISYLGHSGTRTWDNSITEPVQLNNKVNRHPLITDFGCSTARFAEPDVVSFSQLFVTGIGGQAIAYIGNSSLGFLSTTLAFPQIFYKKILTDSVGIIGEAHRLAKLELVKNYGNTGVYQLFTFTNTLIGDPVIKLPLPPKANLSVSIAGLSYSPEIPSDDIDSLRLIIAYNNSGKAVAGKFSVQVTDRYQNTDNVSLILEKQIPLYSDTLSVSIPIKNKSGTHDISIALDPQNLTEELKEDDNSVHISLEVASASIKSTLLYSKENSLANSVILLNPAVRQSSSKIQYEYDTRNDFRSSHTISADMGDFFTKISMPGLSDNQRYWFRLNRGSGSYSIPGSFWTDSTAKYHLSDSISFVNAQLNSIKYKQGRLFIDTAAVRFSIISAGYLDGRTVSVQINGQELVPEVSLRGHHVCIVEDSTFKFVKYVLYDLITNANATAEYSAMLDTLSSKYLIMVGVMDEGTVSSAALRNKLKSYGSRYIDSVEYRGSWAFIGKRGAAPGSVPEAFSRAGKGSVRVDTTFYMPRKTGVLLTGRIGPVSQWENLKVDQQLPAKAEITYTPLAISSSGAIDTLGNIQLVNGAADLSSIDAGKYPYLHLLAAFKANQSGESPILKSLGVNYSGVPELGLNYQIVSVARDTIKQGEMDTLKFFVANAGESRADSVQVLVDLLRPDNKTRSILDTLIANVGSMSLVPVSYNYLSNVHDTHGNMAFIIKIDPENRIREIYEDNNSYKIPFFVKQDTTPVSISDATLKVTYDGQEILDGDYVSPSPEIRLSLNYPVWFPYSDTTALSITMDSERLNFSNMNYSFDTIKRKAEYSFIPKLSPGEHTLEVSGNNIYGNLETGKGYRMTFTVTDQAKVMDVYNYPNPAAGSTSFTFRLSGIPEDLRIKVYTVAGRLVREIKQNPASLSANFNHIPFDCRDQDGNNLANGVYLYKIIVRDRDHAQEVIQKMAIVR